MVLHLLFANDLILFVEATTRQARYIDTVIKNFCLLSEQNVGTSKV